MNLRTSSGRGSRSGSACLALAATLAAATPALADSHKLLVLQSEGRTDAATRTKIDAAVFKLAAASEPQAAAGGLNFSDAATAVGCKPDTALCKDEVLGMLSVDEIVITTIAARPGGLEITVRRVSKGGASRDASMVLPAGASPDKLDGIAPLFGGPPPASKPAITTDRPAGTEAPVVPPPTAVEAPPPSPIEQPAAQPAEPSDATTHRRLEIAGMAGGGALAVIGLLLWSAASSTQNDIDNAPTATRQDLMHLRDLESKGDTYATLGNLFVISGLVVGGVSTYLFFRDRGAASRATARLTPAVFPHGAGLAFTLGGTP
ncbi:MAG TPA: hypothetical protein VFP84_15195 [Kofleriaceae bacterium]|nr:hypothetical protein [Kofleriaceae bacterium]